MLLPGRQHFADWSRLNSCLEILMATVPVEPDVPGFVDSEGAYAAVRSLNVTIRSLGKGAPRGVSHERGVPPR